MYSWKTVLVTIAVLFGLKIWNPFLVENMKWSWFDFLHQQHEIEEVQDIVLVDIDEKTAGKIWSVSMGREMFIETSCWNPLTPTLMYSLNYSKNLIDLTEMLNLQKD